MDNKKLGAPSKNVAAVVRKTNPPLTTGIKTDRLYNSPEYKAALNDASTAFRDKINQRQGKGDRENGPDSPMTSLIKQTISQKNVFRKK